MKKNNLLSYFYIYQGLEIDLKALAKDTKNYTGAEIEAVVKSASSYSFERNSNLLDFSKEAKLSENS
jgi:vesicle-fusing ATPase